MLLKLSKNAFVRQYGEFTYVLERIKCYDQMFKDAEVFMRWITRTPRKKSEILKNICGVYAGADTDEIDPAKKEQMQTDEKWGAKKVCGACVSSVCLDATGYYYPCPAFAGVNLGSCYEHDLKWIWTESPETKRIRAVCGKDFPKCLHCPDRDYCSVCMCRNFNETGDMFKPAQHFCDVARLNHEVVDEAQAKRLASKKH